METNKMIDQVVDRFVGDIGNLLRHVHAESLAGTLGTLSTRLHDELGGKMLDTKKGSKGRVSKKQEDAVPEPKGTTKASSPSTAVSKERPQGDKPATKAARSAPASSSTRSPPAVKPRASTKAAPGAEKKALPPTPDHSVVVLDALRSLDHPTAADVATRCELSKTTTYVVLQALVDENKVEKIKAGRAIEYVLTPSGKGGPSMRSKKSPPVPKAAAAPRMPSPFPTALTDA